MKLTKFCFMMFIGTALSLVYVQMQVQIFDLAYRGKQKEKEITRLMDANGDVHSKICLLQSASNLGGQMLDQKSSMQFLSQDHIVHISMSEVPWKSSGRMSTAQTQKKQGFLAGLFLPKSQAEAWPIR